MPTSRYPAAITTLACLMVMASAVPAPAQSLGDLALREAERRKEATRTATRVYTNEDLPAVDAPVSPSQPAAAPGSAETTEPAQPGRLGPTVMEEDPTTHKVNIKPTAPPREKRPEAYWRVRAKEVRERLTQATADLESAEAGLEALATGPQTPAAARERAIVAATVQRLQSEVRYRQQDVTKLQMQAEFNKVPAEWIQ